MMLAFTNNSSLTRLVAREEGGQRELQVLHCLYGEPVLAFLQSGAAFLAKNPREFVILDFQHLYQFTSGDHATMLQLISQQLGSRLCPSPSRQAALP